jgi:antitoxin component of RelBE/YafQ-DinJ toxin-antitoxin module
MSRLEQLLEAEALAAEEAERTSDPLAPLPDFVNVSRGSVRSRNLQVRFNDDEFAQLLAYAEERGLPMSTVVRLLVLRAIAPVENLESALNQLEADLAAIRRAALKH